LFNYYWKLKSVDPSLTSSDRGSPEGKNIGEVWRWRWGSQRTREREADSAKGGGRGA